MDQIELKHITKIYTNGVRALHEVTFTLSQGELAVVMGSSGSGKSTLLQVAGLLDKATTGEVRIGGEDVSGFSQVRLADVRMRRLGFIFQAFHLNPHLTLCENIMVPMLINDHFRNRKEMWNRAMDLMEQQGIAHRKDHYPGQVSGGEQQRTAIARALANDPDFILADEPTGSLDSKNEQRIFEELKKLGTEGRGVLVVCHNEAVRDFADRLLIMKDGRLV